jgi:bifunctional pyridoxal-dependent enzyme with beta-cystathionase and maltose regulon repressor activities
MSQHSPLGQSPKFKVGEEVILQSSYTELNGDAIVLAIHKSNGTATTKEGEQIKVSSPYCYELNVVASDGGRWAERALRKKHQPGEMDFEQLMNWMRQPVTN